MFTGFGEIAERKGFSRSRKALLPIWICDELYCLFDKRKDVFQSIDKGSKARNTCRIILHGNKHVMNNERKYA